MTGSAFVSDAIIVPATLIIQAGREIEVLHLLAAGRTKHKISRRSSINEHTAKSHVTNILNKLGVHNRTQAAAMATYHQLFGPQEL